MTSKSNVKYGKKSFITGFNDYLNFNLFLDEINDAAVVSNFRAKIISANKITNYILGYSNDELIGENLSFFLPYKILKIIEMYQRDDSKKILNFKESFYIENKSGEYIQIELSMFKVIVGNENVNLSVIKKIDDINKFNEKLLHLSCYDKLTGLPNMERFESDLNDLILSKNIEEKKAHIFMLNINKFSQINLAFGRHTGDFTLKEFSKRLSNTFKIFNNLVYRYTDDVFFIIYFLPLLESNISEIFSLIKDIDIDIEVESEEGFIKSTIKLTTSTVVIADNLLRESVDENINLLEEAIKNIKNNENVFYKVINNKDLAFDNFKIKIIKEINSIYFMRELSIALQPQFNKNRKILSSEVLLRWKNSKLGNIKPNVFIPIIEESGHIVDVTNLIFDKVSSLISDIYNETGKYQKVSINISVKQILQPDFCFKITKAFKAKEIPCNIVTLEITESILVSNFNLVTDKIFKLNQEGFEFSLDDFGTGYSSLSYIKNLPINEIKIDKMFIDDIVDENKPVAIVNLILAMASTLNLRVVAEGVEKEFQKNYLNNYNCDLIQGYYYSKPLLVNDWKNLILKESLTNR